jgi:hypothetical protein
MPTNRRAPCSGPRWLSSGRRGRETRRVAVPQDLVAALRFGNENLDDVGPEFWSLVKDRMEEFIEAHLPDGAVGVRAILDEVRTEVVVSYRLDA